MYFYSQNWVICFDMSRFWAERFCGSIYGSRIGTTSQKGMHDLKMSLAITEIPDLDYLFF